MNAIRTTKILFISGALLLSSMAFAQSGPDEDVWVPYGESGQSETKPAEPAQQAKSAKPAPKPTKAEESKTDDTEQIKTSVDEAGSDAANPAAEPKAPETAKTDPAGPKSDAKAARPEQQDSAQSDPGQNQPDNKADSDSEYESEAGSGGETSVFSGPMAMSTAIGCASGGWIPGLTMASALTALGGAYLCATMDRSNSSCLFGLSLIFGYGAGYIGTACLGPMSSAGAIVGAVISGISSERPWWLPVLAGGPGLLVGMLGSGLIIAPIGLGLLAFSVPGYTLNTVRIFLVVGSVAALIAGPFSMAGIILADSLWGASQQSENDHMSSLPKNPNRTDFLLRPKRPQRQILCNSRSAPQRQNSQNRAALGMLLLRPIELLLDAQSK